MYINDMKFSDLTPGLRIVGAYAPEKLGTIIYIDYLNSREVHYRWDGEIWNNSWHETSCTCKVLLDELGNPVVEVSKLNTGDRVMQLQFDKRRKDYLEGMTVLGVDDIFTKNTSSRALQNSKTFLRSPRFMF